VIRFPRLAAATYAWIIDTDLLTPDRAVKVTGPSDAPDDLIQQLENDPEAGDAFGMLDGDGNLQYLGRILGGGLDAEEDAAFGPLTDFGVGDGGCTDIQYLLGTRWESL
jgi:hypothetical protein